MCIIHFCLPTTYSKVLYSLGVTMCMDYTYTTNRMKLFYFYDRIRHQRFSIIIRYIQRYYYCILYFTSAFTQMFLFDHAAGLQLLGVHSWREREFHTALRRRRRSRQQIKKKKKNSTRTAYTTAGARLSRADGCSVVVVVVVIIPG